MSKIVGIILALVAASTVWAKPDPSAQVSVVESAAAVAVPASAVETTVVHHAPAVQVVHAPTLVSAGSAISKTVHYSNTPMLAGYSSTIYKPDLSDLAAALHPKILASLHPNVEVYRTFPGHAIVSNPLLKSTYYYSPQYAVIH